MAAIGPSTNPTFAVLAVAGIVGGLVLLVRGFNAFGAARRIGGTSTSKISALAIGEVLVSGTAEPVELTLVSPLQSVPCLYYRSRVRESGDADGREIFAEERAVGFRVRDASGTLRVFPRGARFDVPDRFDVSSGSWDADPPGLVPRTGSAFGPTPDHQAQIAALLTVRDPGADAWARQGGPTGAISLGSRLGLVGAATSRRHYREARIEPGDIVTVIGQVLPFGELTDPAEADQLDGSSALANDPEVAADLAEARAAGLLADTPAEAWGNAAIEGFGIGRPVRAPDLDPAADRPPPPDSTLASRVASTFDIAPQDLVMAASDQVPLILSIGAPLESVARQQGQFVVGLLGATLAVGSAMMLALLLEGAIR